MIHNSWDCQCNQGESELSASAEIEVRYSILSKVDLGRIFTLAKVSRRNRNIKIFDIAVTTDSATTKILINFKRILFALKK